MFTLLPRRALAVFALVLAMMTAHAAPEAAREAPDASALLRAGEYAQLEAYYGDAQRRFAAGRISGDELRNEFRAFYPTAPDLQAGLDGWVTAYPKSYPAHLARGIYWKRRGWDERGEKYMSETSQSQIDNMDDAMANALKDLGESIGLDRKPFLSYFHSLDIGRQYLGHEKLRKLYDQAAALDSRSVGLHLKFMTSLEPKWGGSIDAMEAFLKESKRSKLSAEGLQTLATMVAEEQGLEYTQNGNLAAAEAAYRKAWSLSQDGDCACIGNSLNKLLFQTQQYGAAVIFLNEYLQRKPGDLWALDNRGTAKYWSQDPEGAVQDWLIPAQAGDSYAQNKLGMLYLMGYNTEIKPDYPKSVEWLRKAAAQGEQEAIGSLAWAETQAAKSP